GPSASGDTAVIAVAQATAFPAGIAATVPTAAGGGGGGATPFATNIDHVWITVQKVALVPDGSISPGEPRLPDPAGEQAVEDGAMNDAGLVSAAIVPPRTIDLRNLPPESLADVLNEIKNIPAGKYGKIRLFYSDPKVHFIGAADNTAVKPTANYHLDIHFVGGGMVIPVRTNPGGGVAVHNVVITVVLGKDGLKITENSNGYRMRPQVFATVDTVQMAISGVADNVVAGEFDVATAPSDGRSFHAVYGAIGSVNWFFKAPERENPVQVGPSLGVAALRSTAIVKVIGTFDSALTLHADEIWITFPVNQPGTVAAAWTDNSFKLNVGADNIVVRAQPDRLGAYYDNNVTFDNNVSSDDVVPGVPVTARGYAISDPSPGRIDAYWISIGP
ncbi:MAG: DUF4382 domain-containing protein, partial [Deltaproteobacteria bacterium]